MPPKIIRLLRRTIQVLSLGFFLYLFIFATYSNPVPGLAEMFYRLDPLAALTAMLAGRVFITGMALAGLTLLLTLMFGRAWCGWLCPLGTTLDLIRPGRRHRKNMPEPPSEKWRTVKYILLIAIVTAAVFGNQTLMFLDPITLLTRTLANAIWPAFSFAAYAVEGFLYNFDPIWGPLDSLHAALIYPLFRDFQPVYSQAVPVFLLFAAIVALNWRAERFWCRYLCPLGGLLGLISRFSFFRRVTADNCSSCAVCSRHCPTGTIDPARGYASDPAECTLCYDCAAACPNGSSTFQWQIPGWNPAANQPYDPSRRGALKTIGLSAVSVALLHVEPVEKRTPADLIRPPGANLVDFEELCIRCNECVRACPTGGLQASGLEGGLRNLFTPRLEPRLGYCNFNCNACSQVCPSGAIPKLALEVKQHTPMGLARVDRNRCLPWAYNITCIVCEESCPVADKAIKLQVDTVVNAHGETVTIQRPYVVKEMCIGCGMCEYQCPMSGDAAIHVYTYTEAGGYIGNNTAGEG